MAVRQAAAHTLTLRAAASLEFASPTSLALPPILASGSFDLPRASGKELVHDPSGTETLVFVPASVFDQPPPREAVALPQGRPWIRADFSEHVKGSSLLSQFLLRSEGRDPGFLLAEIAWGARAAAPLGRRVINGVAAMGYLVRVDPALAAARASGPRARGFVRTIGFVRQALGGSGKTGLQTVWIWVDRAHRVVSIRSSPPGSGIGTTLMTLTSFAGRVRAIPPARSQTVDLAALTPAGDIDRD